jgi:hypothetical protein
MHADHTRYVAGALLLIVLGGAACSDTLPADVTAPSAVPAITLKAEPSIVRPEILPPLGACRDRAAFRTRFVVILGDSNDGIVQGLDVSFVDSLGAIALPTVLGASAFDSRTPVGVPVTLPTSSPIPIPQAIPNDGFLVPIGGTRQVPVTLQFGCEVRPHGTLFVTARTRDRHGRSGSQRLAIAVTE